MQRRSDASCWGTMFQRKPRHRSLRVLRTGTPAVLSPHRSYWAHRTSKGGNTTMLTRRVFMRGSAIVLAGMGVAPGWLARAAAAESKKRKTLVAIFMRGAADGLNIVVPCGEQRLYRSRWDVRIEQRDATSEGALGQTAVGHHRSDWFTRRFTLAFRCAGFHGVRHAWKDNGGRMAESSLASRYRKLQLTC